MCDSESTDSDFELETAFNTNNENIVEQPKELVEGVETLKIEVYDRAYLEEYHYIEFWQIQYYLPPSIQTVEHILETKRNKECFEAMRDLLCPIITTSRGFATKSVHAVRSLQLSTQYKNDIASVLDLVPYEGFLAPRECQLISVSFYPKPDTTIKANAICSVLGGVSRNIFIQGRASDMGYELDSDFIDFGRQVLNESKMSNDLFSSCSSFAKFANENCV